MEKVFSIVRHRNGFRPVDQMKGLDVNTAMWWKFMFVTLQAAVQLGNAYTQNLRSTKNQPKKSFRLLFQVTGLTTIDRQQPTWRETTLLTDRVVQFAAAKTYVFSDSVRCLGGVSTELVKAWRKQGLNGFWKHVISKIWIGSTGSGQFAQGSLHWEFSTRSKRWWLSQSVNLSTTKEGSSSCNVQWHWLGDNEETKNCIANALAVAEYARRFTRGHWSFLVPGSEKKWYGTHVNKPDGEWERELLRAWCSNFAESGHTIFRATSALERGELKSNGKGVISIHFNCSDDTIEFILRPVLSVNQLSVYGAVAETALARDSRGMEKPAASENLESVVYTDRISYC